MNSSLVYNIPARLLDEYRGRNVILRSAIPGEIVFCLWLADRSRVRFIQLLSSSADTSVLEATGEGIPIEIVLSDPSDYQRLYSFANLLDSHPVRIAIPVVEGFSKAVKLAVSLNYAVKLEVEQPDEALVQELESVLDLYLHLSFVRQPIEFFHTMMLSMYRNEDVLLWEIAEENPRQVRFISDDGEETISKRFAGVKLDFPINNFISRFGESLVSEQRECFGCEYFNRCGGYFKWPDKNYRCDGIKRLFQTLTSATREVRQDLAQYQAVEART